LATNNPSNPANKVNTLHFPATHLSLCFAEPSRQLSPIPAQLVGLLFLSAVFARHFCLPFLPAFPARLSSLPLPPANPTCHSFAPCFPPFLLAIPARRIPFLSAIFILYPPYSAPDHRILYKICHNPFLIRHINT
jgi:hypothetical protein